ncbi:MAG: hypothetical protein H0X03_04825 [Nitrosopumilus sp.]|nr:hypothetical protein [Nitrosopumilus sp.]
MFHNDDLKNRYENLMMKLKQKHFDDTTSWKDAQRRQNEQTLKEQLDLMEDAMNSGDNEKAQIHAMKAHVYKNMLDL